jgi:hypothetical protein
MGVFSKFAAALVAIPSPVLGGMTSKLEFSAFRLGMLIYQKPSCFVPLPLPVLPSFPVLL